MTLEQFESLFSACVHRTSSGSLETSLDHCRWLPAPLLLRCWMPLSSQFHVPGEFTRPSPHLSLLQRLQTAASFPISLSVPWFLARIPAAGLPCLPVAGCHPIIPALDQPGSSPLTWLVAEIFPCLKALRRSGTGQFLYPV